MLRITCPKGHELIIDSHEIVATGDDITIGTFSAHHPEGVEDNCYPGALTIENVEE